MSKSNSALAITVAHLMTVFTVSAQAQMVVMAVRPGNGHSATPVRVQPAPRDGHNERDHRDERDDRNERDHRNGRGNSESRPTPVVVHVYPGAHPINPGNH